MVLREPKGLPIAGHATFHLNLLAFMLQSSRIFRKQDTMSPSVTSHAL